MMGKELREGKPCKAPKKTCLSPERVPPSSTVQVNLGCETSPFLQQVVFWCRHPTPRPRNILRDHFVAVHSCEKQQPVNNNQQQQLEKCCWESMVLRDLQGMSRYIRQNLPHTGASNITLYTTFINHWVVSPLWDMVVSPRIAANVL